MTQHHQGSCLCGKVKYQLDGEFQSFFLCHCQRCQKDTGSAHAANLFANAATLTWLQGANDVRRYQYPDSRHVKAFCHHCGSALPVATEDPALVVVPAGSLDTPVPILPNGKIYLASAAAWATSLEDVASFAALPSNLNS